MANPFFQYLQDTRGELRHVAWPTRTQTIVYAVIVAAISVGIAVYLGFFDFLFTTGLTRIITALPQHAASSAQQTSSSTVNINQPATTAPAQQPKL